jgi:hypothetical protein
MAKVVIMGKQEIVFIIIGESLPTNTLANNRDRYDRIERNDRESWQKNKIMCGGMMDGAENNMKRHSLMALAARDGRQ